MTVLPPGEQAAALDLGFDNRRAREAVGAGGGAAASECVSTVAGRLLEGGDGVVVRGLAVHAAGDRCSLALTEDRVSTMSMAEKIANEMNDEYEYEALA